MATRLGDIEGILMGLEKIDIAYNEGYAVDLIGKYIESINSIRSVLGFEILVNEEDLWQLKQ